LFYITGLNSKLSNYLSLISSSNGLIIASWSDFQVVLTAQQSTFQSGLNLNWPGAVVFLVKCLKSLLNHYSV